MSDFELKVAEASTADLLDKSELLTDLEKALVPLKFVGHNKLRCAFAPHEIRNAFANQFIRYASYYDTDRQRQESKEDGDTPLDAVDPCDLEGSTTDKNNESLSTNHDGQNDDKEPDVSDAFKNVETVVKATIVQSIEDLHPDEGVEDQSGQCVPLLWRVVGENRVATKVEDECDH